MSNTLFNFEAAWAACKDDAFAKDWLTNYRANLEALTPTVAMEILGHFAAGNVRAGFDAFYGPQNSWADLVVAAGKDVTNTAQMAERAAAVANLLRQGSVWAAKVLISVLLAGFCA